MNTVIDGEYVVTTLPGGGEVRELMPAPPEPAVPVFVITKLAFKNRFPRAKWRAAKAAAVPGNQFDDFFESFNLATYINLKLPETIASVSSMSGAAIPADIRLTQQEVDAVLTVPASPGEIPLEMQA